MITKKAQSWYLDLVIGIMIFVLSLSIFFKTEVNQSREEENIITNMKLEAKFIASSLASQGNPTNWTLDDVVEIGITDNYRINQTKLEAFASMDYETAKEKLRTIYDFYVFFKTREGIQPVNDSIEGVGKPGVNSTNVYEKEKPKHIVTTSRLLIRNSMPTKMVVYLWK